MIRINKKIKNFKRLIHLSTDEVYGDVLRSSKEKDVLNPSSPYSSSKASCDLLIKSYIRTFKLPSPMERPKSTEPEGAQEDPSPPQTIHSSYSAVPPHIPRQSHAAMQLPSQS